MGAKVAKRSAGLLLFRKRDGILEVLLAHPGGPFWTKKDQGAWTLPKGQIDDGEEPQAAARREFAEEIGFAPEGELIALGEIKQPSGKSVLAWAIEGDCDPATVKSNLFPMEWPPRSGKVQQFPEIDRAEWFAIPAARAKILAGQVGFLDRLEQLAS